MSVLAKAGARSLGRAGKCPSPGPRLPWKPRGAPCSAAGAWSAPGRETSPASDGKWARGGGLSAGLPEPGVRAAGRSPLPGFGRGEGVTRPI